MPRSHPDRPARGLRRAVGGRLAMLLHRLPLLVGRLQLGLLRLALRPVRHPLAFHAEVGPRRAEPRR